MTMWTESDVNKDGVLDLAEFKVFFTKNNENMKKRFGESEMGDDAECDKWYDAYNAITPLRVGVSIGDFKEADEVLKCIGEEAAVAYAKEMFKPLTKVAIKRIMRFKPDTLVKMT